MRRKRSPERGQRLGDAARGGPSAPSRGPGRVALTGDWPAPRAAALRALLTVVDDPQSPVDWLLVAVGAVAPPPSAVCQPPQPRRPRVAVIDPGGWWPEGADSDVYLAGDVEPADLVAALRLAGADFTIRRTAAPVRRAPPPLPIGANGRAAELTGREAELLQALCAGLGNDQIARQLHISRSTVEFHLTRIFRKLEVSSRAEAIVRALRHDPDLATGALR